MSYRRYRFNPIHKIQIMRVVGDSADDAGATETVVATVYSQRMDSTGNEIGAEGQQYFRQRTKYKVKADITVQNKEINDLVSSFGQRAFGSEPFGSAGSDVTSTYGSKARTNDLVYDMERRRRYKIVGVTQTMDDRYLVFTCEEIR